MNMFLIMIVLPFLLVMPYQVRWLFHMISVENYITLC